MKLLRDLVRGLLIHGTIDQIDNQVEITGISYDYRDVTQGNLFFCIHGHQWDGHEFAEEASKNGAAAIIAEKNVNMKDNNIPIIIVPSTRKAMAIVSTHFYNNPSSKLNIIGVTGTNGKTSTTHFIKELLDNRKEPNTYTGLISTVKQGIGDKVIMPTTTTPESYDLQKLLYEMIESNVKYASVEVSSHAVDQNRILGSEFTICVFTNISQDHLDYHGTFSEYLRCKGRLFANMGLTPENNGKKKVAVINLDDDNAPYIINQTAVQVLTYGIKQPADVTAKNIRNTLLKSSFDLQTPWGEVPVSIDLPGDFTIYNVLAAVSVALIEGFSLDEIKSNLTKLTSVKGRFQKIDAGQDFLIIIDYAHTPDSLDNVLRTLSRFVTGRIATVFGCGGERDKEKRPLMGQIAAKYSDKLFITSDNPRGEDPKTIIYDIIYGIQERQSDKCYLNLDRQESIAKAIEWADSQDAVLIAGKGHEDYQILKDKTIRFDDAQVARDELVKRGYQSNEVDRK